MVEKFISEILSAISLGIIGLVFWQVRKNNGYEEKLREETRKEVKSIREKLIVIDLKQEGMAKDWDKYSVEKAYPSAKRSHHRLDDIDKRLEE